MKGELNTTRDIFRFYTQEWLKRPKQTLSYTLFKLFRPWYATDSETYERRIALIQMPYVILSLYGLYVCLKRKIRGTGFLLLIVSYFWMVAFCVLPLLRYMIPAMAIVTVLAAAGIDDLKRTHFQRERP